MTVLLNWDNNAANALKEANSIWHNPWLHWRSQIGLIGGERQQVLAQFSQLSVLCDFLQQYNLVAFGAENGKGKLHRKRSCRRNKFGYHPVSYLSLETLLTERHTTSLGDEAWCESCTHLGAHTFQGPTISGGPIAEAIYWVNGFLSAIAEMVDYTERLMLRVGQNRTQTARESNRIEAFVHGKMINLTASTPLLLAEAGFDIDVTSLEEGIRQLGARLVAAYEANQEGKKLTLDAVELHQLVADSIEHEEHPCYDAIVGEHEVIGALSRTEQSWVDLEVVQTLPQRIDEATKGSLAQRVIASRLASGELNPALVDRLVEQNDLDYGDANSIGERVTHAISFYVESQISYRCTALYEHYEMLKSANNEPASLVFTYNYSSVLERARKLVDCRDGQHRISAYLVPTAEVKANTCSVAALSIPCVGDEPDIAQIAEMTVTLAQDESVAPMGGTLQKLYDAAVAIVRG